MTMIYVERKKKVSNEDKSSLINKRGTQNPPLIKSMRFD